MSSSNNTAALSQTDDDQGDYQILPELSSSTQRLANASARDRISVRMKRQKSVAKQPQLNALLETDDQSASEPFSPEPEAEEKDESPVRSHPEVKQAVLLPVTDSSQLNEALARLRVGRRPRNRSADDILSAKTDKSYSPTRLEVSSLNENNESRFSPNPQVEHIYDNAGINEQQSSDTLSVKNESSTIHFTLKKRDPISSRTNPRHRPLTMIPSNETEEQMKTELENSFGKMKLRPVAKPKPPEEQISSETKQVDESPSNILIKKPFDSPQRNRRQTVGGNFSPTPQKTSTDEKPPIPSGKPNRGVSDINERTNRISVYDSNRPSPTNVDRDPAQRVSVRQMVQIFNK